MSNSSYNKANICLFRGEVSIDEYVIIDDNIYDVSSFMMTHPGGIELFKPYLKKNCTQVFNDYHQREILSLISHLRIGKICDYSNQIIKENYKVSKDNEISENLLTQNLTNQISIEKNKSDQKIIELGPFPVSNQNDQKFFSKDITDFAKHKQYPLKIFKNLECKINDSNLSQIYHVDQSASTYVDIREFKRIKNKQFITINSNYSEYGNSNESLAHSKVNEIAEDIQYDMNAKFDNNIENLYDFQNAVKYFYNEIKNTQFNIYNYNMIIYNPKKRKVYV
eukprot:Mrub_07920.p1 GENE.Mrub_07920~~Mrub_07920.p1  ORF type:complete len:280 (-),score=45.91 Mrub_07920:38-877(-)